MQEFRGVLLDTHFQSQKRRTGWVLLCVSDLKSVRVQRVQITNKGNNPNKSVVITNKANSQLIAGFFWLTPLFIVLFISSLEANLRAANGPHAANEIELHLVVLYHKPF